MASATPEQWERARRARDTLHEQLAGRTDVGLIDIGRDLDLESGQPTSQLVVRVHVRRLMAGQGLGLPPDIDGIPVRTMTGDYHLAGDLDPAGDLPGMSGRTDSRPGE